VKVALDPPASVTGDPGPDSRLKAPALPNWKGGPGATPEAVACPELVTVITTVIRPPGELKGVRILYPAVRLIPV
jgi:hypothetical protein